MTDTTHDDNATRWRDLADQLTPQQITELEYCEREGIPPGMPDPAQGALNCARMMSRSNIVQAMYGDIAPPPDAVDEPSGLAAFDRRADHRPPPQFANAIPDLMFGQSNGLENTLPSNQVVPELRPRSPRATTTVARISRWRTRSRSWWRCSPRPSVETPPTSTCSAGARRSASCWTTSRSNRRHRPGRYALAERRLRPDFDRYNAPYDLHRDGEWERVGATIFAPRRGCSRAQYLAIEFAILILSETHTPANTQA